MLLLENIFNANNYSIREFIVDGCEWSLFYAKRIGNRIEEFYIVADKNKSSTEDLKKLYSYGIVPIFEHIKKQDFYEAGFDKNCSFIICYNGISNEINDLIWQIEKNSYLCKKHIIQYTSEMEKEISELCDKDYSNENLNKILNDIEAFQNFKINNCHSGYRLLVEIFIKLPFLHYSSSKKNAEDLEKAILNELEKAELLSLLKSMLSLDWNSIECYEDFQKYFKGGKSDE